MPTFLDGADVHLGEFHQIDYQSDGSDEDIPLGQQWISFQSSLDRSHGFLGQ
jgi:hypothetical protein